MYFAFPFAYYRYFTTTAASSGLLSTFHLYLYFAIPFLFFGTANNNPAVENTCQSVECVTTHNIFFIGQQKSVVSSRTACWGSQFFYLYKITPLFLLRLFPALGPFVGVLKCFNYVTTPLFLFRFHVAMLVSYSGTLSCQSFVLSCCI